MRRGVLHIAALIADHDTGSLPDSSNDLAHPFSIRSPTAWSPPVLWLQRGRVEHPALAKLIWGFEKQRLKSRKQQKEEPVLDGRVGLILPTAWLPSADSARGSAPRCVFIRDALRRRLRQLGHPVEKPARRAGTYDRAKAGLVSARTMARLEERERRAESRRNRQPTLKEAPVVVFTFSPSSNIGAAPGLLRPGCWVRT